MLAIILAASVFAATPVSPTTGILGKQMFSTPVCDTFATKSCMGIINNSTAAVQIGFSFYGPSGPDGIANALYTENGLTQCVFTVGLTGTRCVSVIGPGEQAWVQFPSAQVVMVTVTEWEMPGLQQESPSVIPGTAAPATVIGDQALIIQGSLAMRGRSANCPVDLRVQGNNTLYASMCQ